MLARASSRTFGQSRGLVPFTTEYRTPSTRTSTSVSVLKCKWRSTAGMSWATLGQPPRVSSPFRNREPERVVSTTFDRSSRIDVHLDRGVVEHLRDQTEVLVYDDRLSVRAGKLAAPPAYLAQLKPERSVTARLAAMTAVATAGSSFALAK